MQRVEIVVETGLTVAECVAILLWIKIECVIPRGLFWHKILIQLWVTNNIVGLACGRVLIEVLRRKSSDDLAIVFCDCLSASAIGARCEQIFKSAIE